MKKLLLSAALAIGVLASSAAAQAAVWITSGTNADGAFSASADITQSLGSLTIGLTSLISNPTSSGQNVSGIRIYFANDPTAASLVSSAGTLIEIADGGAVTPHVGPIDHWGVAVSGGDLFLATAGTGSEGGQPHDLIIGLGPYTNANSSITNRPPQIQGTGTFVVNLTGQTGLPNITGVRILFGTAPTSAVATCTTACGGAVPEPATWAMMIMGFGGAGSLIRRRRRQGVQLAA